MRVSLLLITTLASSFVAAGAHGSGSVEVTVLARRHSLSIAQTFRKILAADHAADYYRSVTTSFFAISAQLNPRIDALLGREAGHLSLGAVELGLPAAKPGGRFPALLQLSPVEAGAGPLAYVVRVAVRKMPDAKRVQELQRAVATLVRAHAGREDSAALQAVTLAPAREQGVQLRLEVLASARVERGEAARVGGQLRALARKLRGALEARLRSTAGVTLAAFDAKLKPHEDSKRLPGLVTVRRLGADLEVRAAFVVKQLTTDEALSTLRQELIRVMESVVPGLR